MTADTTYAINKLGVRQTDAAGNVSTIVKNAAQWVEDSTAPTASALGVASATTLTATSTEVGTAGVYGVALIGSAASTTANGAGVVTVAAQGSVTSAILKVLDDAGNVASLTKPVILATSGNDTFQTTANAEFIFGFGGDDVITSGGGADIITVGTGTVKIIQYVTADSGTFALGATTTNSVDTTAFDVVNGLNTGDIIALAAYTGTAAGSAGANVLKNTVTSGTDTVATTNGVTLADNEVFAIQGTYDSSANTFIGGAYSSPSTNLDTLLVYDGNSASSAEAYEAIVLVGYHGAVSVAAGTGGLLNLA
jgi:hypothetical protein